MEPLIGLLTSFGLPGLIFGLMYILYRDKDKALSDVQDKRVEDAKTQTRALDASANALEDQTDILKGAVATLEALKVQIEMVLRQR